MSSGQTSLQTIITECRRLADMKTNQFWDDSDFTSEINKSLSQLDMILVSKFSDYKLTPVITNTIGTSNLIQLPNDFLKFRGLDIVVNQNSPDGYVTVQPFNFKKRNIRPFPIAGNTIFTPYEMMYRVQGKVVFILPVQMASSYTYRLWYVPDFIPLANPGDTLQSYMDSELWYQYAVFDVAAKCNGSQNLSPEPFMTQKEEVKQMIIQMSAPNRDAGDPLFVTDDRDGGNTMPYGWSW